jgi:AraC-like DNA-binding protein
MLALPGLHVMWSHTTTPACWKRTSELITDGDDRLVLVISVNGAVTRSQLGRDLEINGGDGACILHAEPATMQFCKLRHVALMVPRAALAPFVGDVEQAATRRIPRDNEALRLLTKYVGILREEPALTTPELRYLAVTHIHDLIAMALGATRDAAAIANGRGLRAARLRAIKADILENLGSPELTETAVALRQRVTPRYIRILFETEGITFSEFVLGQRLMRAHRMLSNPHFAGVTITAIAFAAGFGDLSYFNRTVRRRFGATPSELRHGLRQGDPSV